MIRELAQLARRLAEIERRLAGASRPGTVAEVDATAGTVRLDLGGGMLSPALPYVQTAGALKVHSPPSVGQLMMMSSLGGDTEQGFALPLSFGGDNESPSGSGDEHVLTFGSVRVDLTADGLTIVAGGVTVAVTAAGLTIAGGAVSHNGRDIGSTHVHRGVSRGDDSTNPPS